MNRDEKKNSVEEPKVAVPAVVCPTCNARWSPWSTQVHYCPNVQSPYRAPSVPQPWTSGFIQTDPDYQLFYSQVASS